MAISLSNFVLSILFLLFSIVRGGTVTYDFDVGWVYANPDGLQTRPVIGINGQWPIPTIRVTKGDQLVVKVKNSLGNETTSLHFHGLYQNGTTHMDGPAQVTQCAIQPGGSFTYNFTVSPILLPAILHVGIVAEVLHHRSTNPEPTGTTPTSAANTPTASAGPS